MNYYQHSTKNTLTRVLMDCMGLPKDDAALAALGYFPIRYNYLDYDALRQKMLPDGGPVPAAEGKSYEQKFRLVPLDAERLSQNFEGQSKAGTGDAQT